MQKVLLNRKRKIARPSLSVPGSLVTTPDSSTCFKALGSILQNVSLFLVLISWYRWYYHTK